MEKVVLLVEHSGIHLRCLLNPEQLELKRDAGVVARHSLTGSMTGAGLSDDPLLYRGGGTTELTLNLLFDIGLVPPGPQTSPVDDVRTLTGPVWDLAENPDAGSPYGRPPTMRLLWGTSWNLRAVVAAVAERLEQFDAQGRPRRSWLRLRLLRLDASPKTESAEPSAPPIPLKEARRRMHDSPSMTHGPLGGDSGERMDHIAAERLGHPGLWPLIAEMNGLHNPLRRNGHALQVPVEPLVSSGGGDQ
jgi:hypothetical protein